MQRLPGNSLIEYVLPLVTLFLVGSLIVVLGEVPERFKSMVSRVLYATEEEDTILKVQPLGSTAIPIAGGDGLGTIEITTAKGLTIVLSNYPQNLAQAVETAGANGTTNLALAQLDNLIAQLEASGEATEEELNLFKQLSNQGHRIAAMEKALEAFIGDKTLTADDVDKMVIEFEGRQYTAEELAQQISFGTDFDTDFSAKPEDVGKDPLNPALLNGTDGDEMRIFLEMYYALENQGAMKDPAIKAVVTDLSSDIVFLAEALEHSIVYPTGDEAVNVTDGVISEATHYDSKGICNTGGGNDSGIRCP